MQTLGLLKTMIRFLIKSLAVLNAAFFLMTALSSDAGGEEAHPDENKHESASKLDSTASGSATGELETPNENPLPLAITISGGVSLGAYQAGYLYYLTETIKRNPDLMKLHLVTGASAGMINALLTVIAMGNHSELNPTESLFYKLWTTIHYNDLMDVDKAPPLAFSSRKTLEDLADQVELTWNQGLSEDVDIVVGATTTRIRTYDLAIAEGFSVPRQEEKFVFRIRGRGQGTEPGVSNYVDRTFGSEQALLPFVDVEQRGYENKRANFSIIKQILFASSAIPIVFLPQKIDFCMTEPESGLDESVYALRDCPDPTYTKLFYDGSLADRRPLRMAYRIAQSGFLENSRSSSSWKTRPSLDQGKLPENFNFIYIDPTYYSYPELPSEDEREEALEQATGLFPSFGIFVKGFLTSARAKEVAMLIDEHPEVRKRVQLAKHDFPTVSSLLGKFFGFFDRDFRRFDFYLGMRDARSFVETRLTSVVQKAFQNDKLRIVYPEPIPSQYKSNESNESWDPYFCARSRLDDIDSFQAYCKTTKNNLRILLQVSIDLLYNHCRQLPYDETLEHMHCKLAMQGKTPPRVFGMGSNLPGWKSDLEQDESEFEHAMYLLEYYGFHFKDLGLGPDDADMAMSKIRSELQLYIDTYAKKLPTGERMAVRILGKPAINFFMYAPPEAIIYFTAGSGAELALSATLGRLSWLRYNVSLQVQGFYLLLTERRNILAMTPMLGIEAEILPLSTPLMQTRMGLRAGYQFSTYDRFLVKGCDGAGFTKDSLTCSAPLGQVFLSISFYERIRLQGGVEWFPRWLPPMSSEGSDVWNGFIEVGWQWISPF